MNSEGEIRPTGANLLWLTECRTPYMNELFESLANKQHHRLKVIELSDYEGRFSIIQASLSWMFLNGMCRRSAARVVCGNWGHASSIITMVLSKLLGVHVVFWTDAPRGDPQQKWWGYGILRSIAVKLILSSVDQIWGTGPLAKSQLLLLGMPASKWRSFCYSRKLARFLSIRREKNVGVIRFLALGRLVDIKGYDVLVRALALVKNRCGCVFHCAVYGNGPLRAELERLSTELGLAANISFKGGVDDEDLPHVFSNADVFLHPAKFEPFGVVVLEALASGLPVVTTRSCGAGLEYLSAETGYLVDAGSSEQFAHALIEVINNPNWVTDAGEACRAAVAKDDSDSSAERATTLLEFGAQECII